MSCPLLALALLALTACATVRVDALHRSHGPQRRARSVQLTLTRELP